MIFSVTVMYMSTGYYNTNNYFNMSMCNLSKEQINACRVCRFQGGLTANVKLHFFNIYFHPLFVLDYIQGIVTCQVHPALVK